MEIPILMPKKTAKERKELFPHGHKDCFECEQFVHDQAVKDMLKWFVEWLKERRIDRLDSYDFKITDRDIEELKELAELEGKR